LGYGIYAPPAGPPPQSVNTINPVEAKPKVVAKAVDISSRLPRRSSMVKLGGDRDLLGRNASRNPIMRKAGQPIPLARTGMH
jgi:hypothetical protein